MPVGVQIASLLADGVSLVTTEKTLTDHGISAVAGEDCAMWRGLDGEDICRENDSVQLADAGGVAELRSEPWPDVDEGGDILPFSMLEPQPVRPGLAAEPASEPKAPPSKRKVVVTAAAETKAPAWSPPPANPQTPQPPQTAEAAGLAAPAAQPVVVTEIAPPSQARPTAPSAPPLAAVAPDGGTFYVIASYRRFANADRLARHRADLNARVLAGTVKGIAVYRVAVGPVAKAERRKTRARLADAGFADAWKVKLEKPKLALELASAD